MYNRLIIDLFTDFTYYHYKSIISLFIFQLFYKLFKLLFWTYFKYDRKFLDDRKIFICTQKVIDYQDIELHTFNELHTL